MTGPKRWPTITIKIDAALAADYRTACIRAFGASAAGKKPLDEFITGFVEDRLAEEIAFAEDEAATEHGDADPVNG